MRRAFLVVIDSVGCGGAPDSGEFFNGDVPDTGANTLGHIAQACAEGRAEEGRSGPLHLPNLEALGLGAAIRAASDIELLDLTLRRPGFVAPRQSAHRARTHRAAIGNWRACLCLGTGTTSQMRHPPFLKT